jgi:hypothetical protein
LDSVNLVNEELIIENHSPDNAFDQVLSWISRHAFLIQDQNRPETLHAREKHSVKHPPTRASVLEDAILSSRIAYLDYLKEFYFRFRPLGEGNTVSLHVEINAHPEYAKWIEEFDPVNHWLLFEDLLKSLGIQPSNEMIVRFYGTKKISWMIKSYTWAFIGIVGIIVTFLFGSIYLKPLTPFRVPSLILGGLGLGLNFFPHTHARAQPRPGQA